MLEILFPVHGAILNRHHGEENDWRLQIKVLGTARTTDNVKVNGVPAERSGEMFEAVIPLTECFNTITAEADGERGQSVRTIQVVWDKNSFRRVNFCIDDNIWFLAEIARDRPQSLFDHFYLKELRRLHEKYQLKLTLNLFEHSDSPGFDLKNFPDSYRDEWTANADWLKLAFHARAEFPDRPYQNAETGQLFSEYDRLYAEIRRFAGPRAAIAPANIHWAMVKPDAFPGLYERGVRFLGGMFLNARTRIGEAAGDTLTCDIGYFQSEENSLFIQRHQVRFDFRSQLAFGMESIVCNLEPVPELQAKLTRLIDRTDCDTLHMLSHEQYSFPFYANYLPDHFERFEVMCKMLTEAGFQFVFFSDGMLGNQAWE